MVRVVLLRSRRSRVHSSEGFTLLDMIFVTAVLSLLMAIAVPTVLRSRSAANETAALATLRVVHSGQLSYSLSCGVGLWAADLPALDDPSGAYLPPDLTAVVAPSKSGYTYTLQPGPRGVAPITDCNGRAVALDYYVTAVPLSYGNTGSRGFASSEQHVIWQDTTGAAPLEPFTTAGTVTPIQ